MNFFILFAMASPLLLLSPIAGILFIVDSAAVYDLKEYQREDYHNKEQDNSQGRTISHLELCKGFLMQMDQVDTKAVVPSVNTGKICIRCSCKRKNAVIYLPAINNSHYDIKNNGRRYQRNYNVNQHMERICPVYFGRVKITRRNILYPRQID